MNKKFVLSIVLVAVALSIGALFFCMQANQVPPINDPALTPVVKRNTPEQKNVRASDGIIAFSFEVPKDWLVETRNDGERPMTESELREFLATSHQDDPKASPDKQLSEYAHLTWNQLQKMTLGDMQKYIAQREKEIGAYPNATVASNWLGYVGPTRQIDFYIADYQKAQQELQRIKNEGGKISEEVVDGVKAEVLQYAVEHDENGNPQVTMGASGGKKYYIFFPELKKALLIDKQALGDVTFEKAFLEIIQTLKFSK